MKCFFQSATRACIIATIIAIVSIKPVSANLVTFADFDFNPESNQYYQFVNDGALSGLRSFDSGNFSLSVPVQFRFSVRNTYDHWRGLLPTSPINAHMVMTSSVSAVAQTVSVNGNTFISQGLKDINISFIADTPEHGLTNLLSISSSTGVLFGTDGSSTVSLNSTFDSSLPGGDTVNFDSDFVGFSKTKVRTISLSLNGMTTPFGVDANGYVKSFQASGQGNFGSDPIPYTAPEPMSGAFCLMGMLGLTINRKRRAIL